MNEVYEAFMLGGQEIERLRKESKKLKEELQRKDNIINELKKIFDKENYQYLQRKIEELEERK